MNELATLYFVILPVVMVAGIAEGVWQAIRAARR